MHIIVVCPPNILKETINIGDYDACPCIGPHVNSTHEIGAFRITTTGFEDGVLRIRYKLTPPK